MKKILIFFALFFSAIGAIGGCAYLAWAKQPVLAVGVCLLAMAAFPELKRGFATLKDE